MPQSTNISPCPPPPPPKRIFLPENASFLISDLGDDPNAALAKAEEAIIEHDYKLRTPEVG